MRLDTERFKHPIFWYKVIAVVLFVIFIIWASNSIYLSASFCARCHVIKPYFDSWLTSSHADTECVRCHFPGGLVESVSNRIRISSNLLTYWTEGKIMKKSTKVENELCVGCHVIEREVTPAGDVKIPHTIHAVMKGIFCVDCHKEFVHAREAKAKRTPLMETCYNCHNGTKARDDCAICHSEIGQIPGTHKTSGWKTKHGLNVTNLEEQCMRCHSKPTGFCSECHERKPPSHIGDWDFKHNEVARTRSGGCLVCHKQENFCQKCHGEKHPAGWLKTHPNTARTLGISDCYKCHGKRHCASCHTGSAGPVGR